MDSDNNILILNDIKTRAVKSTKWTVLGEAGSWALRPLVVMILTRLLSPGDFGIVGLALIATGLAQIFQDFGLGKTLIQREHDIEDSANVIFWINLFSAVAIYLILFAAAPFISRVFHKPEASCLFQVLCLQIVFTSLCTVHSALIQRRLEFKRLFVAKLGAAIIPGIVSIPLAYMGMGAWALVWGTLAGSSAQVFLFLCLSKWRPQWRFNFQLAKKLLHFGKWIGLEMFLIWLTGYGDTIAIGFFLGMEKLGIYQVGVAFTFFVFEVFLRPLRPLSYSFFCRLQSNDTAMKDSFLKIVQLLAMATIPLGAGLAILASPISSAVFGQKWKGIEMVILLLGLKESISSLVGINLEAYRASGRPDVNSKLFIIISILYIPTYLVAAPYGLFIFCLSRLGLSIIATVLYIIAANRILKLPFAYLWNCTKLPLAATIPIAIVAHIMNNLTKSPNWLMLICIITTCSITYFLILWLLKRDYMLWVFRFFAEVTR